MDLERLWEIFSQYFEEKTMTPEQWKEILSQYDSYDYHQYIKFDSEKYARNYVINTEMFDILILCWKPGQKTILHGHPKDGCFVKILQWEITETLYNADKNLLCTNIVREWDIMYNHDSIGYHILENASERDTVSLHIYSPGNYKPCLL
jgi:cysteine dioxygenase